MLAEGCPHARACVWESEDNLCESVFSFYHAGLKDGVQVAILDGKSIYLLRHLTSPDTKPQNKSCSLPHSAVGQFHNRKFVNKANLNVFCCHIKGTSGLLMWRYTPVIPALGRQRQENHHEFETNLIYTASSQAIASKHASFLRTQIT